MSNTLNEAPSVNSIVYLRSTICTSATSQPMLSASSPTRAMWLKRLRSTPCLASRSTGAEQVGKKAEHHHYGKSNNPTEIAKHQRCSKRYEYGKEPAKEQQHTPVKVVMLPFVPYLGYIPHIVDEADPVFAIVLIHIITKIMYFAHLIITSYRKTPRKIKNTPSACSCRRGIFILTCP